MIHIEQTPLFRTIQAEKNLRKKARSFSINLIVALKINPYGRELIPVCATERATDNCDAIYQWVKHEMCCPSCAKQFDFSALQQRLVQFLLENSHQTEYVE
ncbi:hypothetical protein VT06_13330 [Arsukibacterium sp. MJ3]|uniref:hypothetical protein n=1 Tax=Arsukibacterium sp. MJ3 TaxID=1632859 RepID=UPI00062720DC|nr:hypothetical protein [Arsukibacterium sp. MJ3]KKO48091.1 hypothetical protein VT06_13330 [Arsukibacterium sp. MJ3]